MYFSPVHYCDTPPIPPAHHNLTSQPEGWDGQNPTAWGSNIKYKCSAGGENKRSDDYSKDDYQLTCQDNNTFTTPEWPTCVPSKKAKLCINCDYIFFLIDKFCPDPYTLATEKIMTTKPTQNETAAFDKIK